MVFFFFNIKLRTSINNDISIVLIRQLINFEIRIITNENILSILLI